MTMHLYAMAVFHQSRSALQPDRLDVCVVVRPSPEEAMGSVRDWLRESTPLSDYYEPQIQWLQVPDSVVYWYDHEPVALSFAAPMLVGARRVGKEQDDAQAG